MRKSCAEHYWTCPLYASRWLVAPDGKVLGSFMNFQKELAGENQEANLKE